MKIYSCISIVTLLGLLSACSPSQAPTQTSSAEKVYVAIEEENRIAVLDSETQNVIKTINLSEHVDGSTHEFSPHNVQVAPDGKSVWVTANHGQGQHGGGHGKDEAYDEGSEEAPDQVIVINPITDTIIKRIPIALGAHLAHVVVTKDGSFAYATSQEKGMVYKIDARSFKVGKEIAAPTGSEPHGLRLSPDGTTAYIALLQGKGLGVLDLRTDALTTVPLEGNAVQTGVTPDGKLVVVSLYDTKKLAVFDVATKSLSYIDLPEDAKGPIQMYATPDSSYIYVADQGYYFEQPTGNRVYKIDLVAKSVIKEIHVGDAPHGVVVSPDGKFVYVTNLLSDDVSIIDTASDAEIGKVKVGTMPNGISVWNQSSGGTP